MPVRSWSAAPDPRRGKLHVAQQTAECTRGQGRRRGGGGSDARGPGGGDVCRATWRRRLVRLPIGHRPGGDVPQCRDVDRSDHDGASRLSRSRPNHSTWRPPATSSRSSSPSGTATAFTRHVHAEQRRLVDHPDHVGPLQDQDPGPPAGGSGPVQRHRRRRVDERDCRRVRSRLGLPQSRADAERVRLRRRVGPGASASGWEATPRGCHRGEHVGRARRRPSRPATAHSTTRAISTPRHVRPDRERAPGPNEAGVSEV